MKWLSTSIITLLTSVLSVLPLQSSELSTNSVEKMRQDLEQNVQSDKNASYGYWGLVTKCGPFPAINIGLVLNITDLYNLDLSSDFIYYSPTTAAVFFNPILEKRVNKTWCVGFGTSFASTLFETKREAVVQPVFSLKKNIGDEAFIRFTSGINVEPYYLVKDSASKYTSSVVKWMPLGFSICTSF